MTGSSAGRTRPTAYPPSPCSPSPSPPSSPSRPTCCSSRWCSAPATSGSSWRSRAAWPPSLGACAATSSAGASGVGFSEAKFEKVGGLYERWNFWVVFTAGFTPIPYKVITVTAGVFKINLAVFLVASAVSRSARFFLVAFLLHKFGEPVREFIDRRFNLLATVFTVLLIGGFIVLKKVL